MGWWLGSDRSSISCWFLECWQWRWDPRNVKPNCGSSLASMEMKTVRGFGFLLSGKRRDKEGKRGLCIGNIWMFSLLIKKMLFRTLVSFFYHSKHTYQTHILYFLNTEKCCLNHDTKHFFFFVLFTLKTHFSTTLFKPQFSHFFKQQFLKTMTKWALKIPFFIPKLCIKKNQ